MGGGRERAEVGFNQGDILPEYVKGSQVRDWAGHPSGPL